MPKTPRGKYHGRKVMGMPVVSPPPSTPVIETRYLRAPDGTVLTARKRKDETGAVRWTAEIPLEMAKDIFTDD
jgi:hypothetical protein